MAFPKPLKVTAQALAGATLTLAAVAVPAHAARQHAASPTTLVFFDSPRGAFARNFNPLTAQPLAPSKAGIYEPLYIVPYIGSQAGKPIPWLATNYKYSSDLKTLTFTIRQGVKWSDGQDFTAKDVAFTMNLEKNNAAVDQVGFSAADSRPTIKVVGSNQVSLTFRKVDASAFAAIVNNLMILPQHIWSKISKPDTYTDPNPVGTGPFTQVENFSPQSYDVAKNPYYWQKGKPTFDRMRFPSYNGNDSATTDLTAGKIDWAGLFIPQAQQVYDNKTANGHHYYAGTVPILLSLNTAKYPFSLPALRHAISMVLNRQAMSVSAEYGYGPVSSLTGLSGQFASWEDKSISGLMQTPNVAAAQKMLTQAGFKMSGGKLMDPKGAPVTFDINVVQGWNDWDAMTQIIAQNVKQLGITATPKPVQFGDYLSRCQTGNFTGTMSWSDSGATPYHSAAFDALFSQFQQTIDSGKQHALVNQMQRLFVQNMPSIPLIINPVWYEYNTTHFTGFPTQSNYYVNAAPYTTPDRLIVMTTLKPTGQ